MYSAAVIPVLNGASFISRSIESIQRQTKPLDEIIVVDDGSTDGTPDVVTRLSREDSRIRLAASAGRKGCGAARNIGTNLSECDWICFLDSDDQWLPEKHELQSRALANCPEAIACFTGIRYQCPHVHYSVNAPSEISLQALRRLNYLGNSSTAMMRRDRLRQVGGFDPTLPGCEDWDLYLKLRRIGEFVTVREPLVLYEATQPVRMSRNKINVPAGHNLVFARALAGVRGKKERREIAAYHQHRLTEVFLDIEEPISAAVAASKLLLVYRNAAGAELLKAACRQGFGEFFGRRKESKQNVGHDRVSYDGQILSFAKGGNGSNCLLSGWSRVEHWGVWSDGPVARLVLTDVALAGKRDVELVIEARGFVTRSQPTQRVRVRVNTADVGELWLGWDITSTSLPIPAEALRSSLLQIDLLPESPISPVTTGTSSDQRLLGIGLKSLQFREENYALRGHLADTPG